ncbi:MAG: hypothetical protein M3R59_03595, partial [Verrucomicrobiota bacterium]|nr:hypothetical protein [Verrucomicrobiota bacterium]
MFFGKGHFLSARRIPSAFIVIALSLGLASVSTSDGSFIQNPDFTSVTYSGNKAVTTLYGQFGSGTGSTLVVSGWDTSGYNFVFAPGTAA